MSEKADVSPIADVSGVNVPEQKSIAIEMQNMAKGQPDQMDFDNKQEV